MSKEYDLQFASRLPKNLNQSRLSQVFDLTVKELKIQLKGKINLIFATRRYSQKLNNKFAGNNYPTDVLSFNYFEKEGLNQSINTTLGEIIICTAIASEQAKKQKVDFENEVINLFVHGLIHIFGFDHSSKSSKARFDKLQSGIINKLEH